MKQKIFVPYETALALKTAGYPQAWADMYYAQSNNELLFRDATPNEVVTGLCDRDNNYEYYYEYYTAAPTYHEVVDWLEKSKDIIVIADLDIGFNDVDVNDKWISMFWYDNKKKINPTDFHYKTREEALNAAILKALEGLQ